MTTTNPEAALADELREVVLPVIGACLLMRSNDPQLADPRIGVAAEVGKAVANHLAALRAKPAGDGVREAITLTPAEVQSKHDRVKWAEGLILQLPETHDGRNSWLLNYGVSEEADSRRAAWIERHPDYGVGDFDKLFPALTQLPAASPEASQ